MGAVHAGGQPGAALVLLACWAARKAGAACPPRGRAEAAAQDQQQRSGFIPGVLQFQGGRGAGPERGTGHPDAGMGWREMSGGRNVTAVAVQGLLRLKKGGKAATEAGMATPSCSSCAGDANSAHHRGLRALPSPRS